MLCQSIIHVVYVWFINEKYIIDKAQLNSGISQRSMIYQILSVIKINATQTSINGRSGTSLALWVEYYLLLAFECIIIISYSNISAHSNTFIISIIVVHNYIGMLYSNIGAYVFWSDWIQPRYLSLGHIKCTRLCEYTIMSNDCINITSTITALFYTIL